MSHSELTVVLFGYESSPFTWKVRYALRLKQVPYHYIVVPSMMPRPMLRDTFGLTYRKIPVLLIGREMYVETTIICEALEHMFPPHDGYQSLYPPSSDNKDYRPLMRGFASYWTDRPLFRVTTGLIPPSVWRTRFGVDRANLIGHKLDADKLARKVPSNKAALDLQLSLLEPLFRSTNKWIFSTARPSLADIALFYQLQWGRDISAGKGIHNLTGGGAADTDVDVTGDVFNEQRYPGLLRWFGRFAEFIAALPQVETHVQDSADLFAKTITQCSVINPPPLIPTAAPPLTSLDRELGLIIGTPVVVAPDDTGISSPITGMLLAITPEELVIKPQAPDVTPMVEVNVHFPRIGFTIRPTHTAKL